MTFKIITSMCIGFQYTTQAQNRCFIVGCKKGLKGLSSKILKGSQAISTDRPSLKDVMLKSLYFR
jgi:hypothetical protein